MIKGSAKPQFNGENNIIGITSEYLWRQIVYPQCPQ